MIHHKGAMVKATIIDPDSPAYALMGRRCNFCHAKITPDDCRPDHMVFESQLGHAAHQRCLEYVKWKWPKIHMAEAEGKVNPQDAIWFWRRYLRGEIK